MTHDPFEKLFGRRRGLKPIDEQALFACVPDELSLGLTEDEIRRDHGERCGLLFHMEDFHEALSQLVGKKVRATYRTIGESQVPLYRRHKQGPRES
jgi:hypothetical protein